MITLHLPWPPSTNNITAVVRKGSPWTPERIEYLKRNYQKLGRDRCAENMGLTHAQVRQKASRLGLKARGVSEACKRRDKKHGEIMKGRKRPDQSDVMKRLHKEGRLALNPEQRARAAKTLQARYANKSEEERKVVSDRCKRFAPIEHPRGALGLKHSDETKRRISKASTAYHKQVTEEQRAERVMKMMKTRATNGTYAPERAKTTWKSGWREIGGVSKYYRSRWEANYAYYLEWLKSRGEIIEWQHEPKTFWFEGIKRGCVSYLPDFRVVSTNGQESYHEVKGWMDDRSKTKIKRMAKYHPQVELLVIDSKAYRNLKKAVSGIVPGWEE
jgi:hypothetical protein